MNTINKLALRTVLASALIGLAGCETIPTNETPEQRAQRQQEGLLLLMMGAGMAQQPAPMPQRICNTHRYGNSYQTICN